MCPNESTLSAYLDGELSTERMQEITEHVKDCRKCKVTLEQLDQTRISLHEADIPAFEAHKRRVYEGILYAHRRGADGFWARRIGLPMPVVLAASALFLVFAGGFIYFLGQNSALQRQPTQLLYANESIQGLHSSSVMIPEFLDQGRESNEVIIEIPGEQEFMIIGEPALIRENEQWNQVVR